MSTEQDLLQANLDALGGSVPSENITNIDRLHTAVVGDSGVGKSYLIAQGARKPHFHWDFDDRRESIANIPGVHVKTLIDKKDTDPVAWGVLEQDIGMLEYLKGKGELSIKSCALDSMTFLRQYAEHQMLRDASKITSTKFKIGATEYLIPKDWDSVSAVQKMLQLIIRRLFALEIDVYAVFHTRQEKDQSKSTKTEFVYKDSLTVDPPNLKMLLPMFNEKWRVYMDGSEHRVQMKANYLFPACTALKGMDETMEASIENMLLKHGESVK